MKRLTMIAIMMSIATLATTVNAQQPMGPGPHHPPGGSTAAPPPEGMGRGPGMTMQMCHQMMGEMMMRHAGGMGPGMGPMGMEQDPKAAARMMEMRGEMMKAMGEIMMKYGRRAQEEAGR